MLMKWYTQNCDGCVKGSQGYHEKLRPIPIGLDLHSRRDFAGPVLDASSSKSQVILQHMLGLRHYSMKQSRNGTLLVPPWDKRTSPERDRAEDAIQCIPHEKKQGDRFPLDEVWNFYTQHKAGLAPKGNGMDTHRVWEMLLLGMIPVVKSGPLDSMYQRVPAVIVHDWGDLCRENLLTEKMNALSTTSAPDEIFTMQYWIPESKASRPKNNNNKESEVGHSIVSAKQLCDDLERGGNFESLLIDNCFDGFQGVGNGLMEYYQAVFVSLAAGRDVINGCTDATKIQALTGSGVAANDYRPVGITWEEACDMSSCVVPNYPGTCPTHFNKLVELFRRDMRTVAEKWRVQSSSVLDDAVIHFRCGDM